MPIFAFTKSQAVYYQLAMNWGVFPFLIEENVESLDEMVAGTLEYCRKAETLKKGDAVVIVAGLPLLRKGATNMIRVETV